MRLYTIESENKQYVAVEGKDGRPVALDSLGINVKDMNDLKKTNQMANRKSCKQSRITVYIEGKRMKKCSKQNA